MGKDQSTPQPVVKKIDVMDAIMELKMSCKQFSM